MIIFSELFLGAENCANEANQAADWNLKAYVQRRCIKSYCTV